MTTDKRKHWEIVWCVRLQFAADYLRYLNMTGRERAFAASAYTANGELEQWAREQIQKLVEKANAMVVENGEPSTFAQSVAQPYLAELEAVAWPNGTVRPVVILRTDQV